MAELVNVHKEFDLGNKFTLNVANALCELLPNIYRIILKYDLQETPAFNDDLYNIVIATSRETHAIPSDFFREDVHAIFQNYFMLDRWESPIHNPMVYPMPIGTFVDFPVDLYIKPIPERKYDFTFIGQIPDTGTRDCFKRHLDTLLRESGKKYKCFVQYTNGFNSGLSHDEYLELLNDSKIVLCPQGAYSLETFRFFEVIKMGAFPMVESLPRLWYYESAPFFKAKWHFLDKHMSIALNALHSIEFKNMIYSLIQYNLNVLDEKMLAKHLASILVNRDAKYSTTLKYELNKSRDRIKNEFSVELQNSFQLT